MSKRTKILLSLAFETNSLTFFRNQSQNRFPLPREVGLTDKYVGSDCFDNSVQNFSYFTFFMVLLYLLSQQNSPNKSIVVSSALSCKFFL